MSNRILVVDDEPIHRDGLIAMIGKLRPAAEIIPANNGREALDIVNGRDIDITITDIRMPVKDGLSFLEEIHGNILSKMQVIMLSGYADFEYAHRAISLGAFDYILKPVNEAKVDELLTRAEKKIDEVKRAEEESKLYSISFPVYLEYQLNKFVKGRLKKAECQELLELFEQYKTGFVITTKIKNYSRFNSDETDSCRADIKYLLKTALDPVFHSISFFDQDNENIMVTILTKEDSTVSNRIEDMLISNLLDLLEPFARQLKEQFSLDITIGIGSRFNIDSQSIINSYMDSVKTVNYAFFFENSTILASGQIEPVRFSNAFGKYVEENEMYDAIKKIDYMTASAALGNILKRFTREQFADPESLKEIVVFILYNSSRLCQSFIREDEYSLLINSIKEDIHRVQSFTGLQALADDYLKKIVDIMGSNKALRYEKIFVDCKEYINKHYMEDLKLDDLADKFNFNSNYFSTLFKNYSNMNLSEYIFSVRMKKAKEYLKNNRLKIYEISEKIGYKDVKYFIRVFKKTYGMSPDEFRKFVANKLL